jgi:hypothetical protein
MADNMGHGLLSTGNKEAQPTVEKNVSTVASTAWKNTGVVVQ